MSKPNLNFKINITSAIPNDVENSSWNLIFSLIDLEGNFNGNQVQVGDILFLDTSTEFPGTLTRYKVTSVVSKGFSVVTCVVVFDDEVAEGSTKPDLGYVIGIDGTLTRPSKFDFDIIADPGSQLLPSKFSVFPFNKNFLDIEKFLSLPGSYNNSKSIIDEVDEKVSSSDVDNIVVLTQQEYDSLATYNARTLYLIKDTGQTPTSTPTPTPTLSSTPTSTPTPTPTSTPTPTNTSTPTPTNTSTPTPTNTSTPTPTPTLSSTNTSTPTPTPTLSSTNTLTPTPTGAPECDWDHEEIETTPTPTPTLSSTNTLTPTPTGAPECDWDHEEIETTPTPTPTTTYTPTQTYTPTPTTTSCPVIEIASASARTALINGGHLFSLAMSKNPECCCKVQIKLEPGGTWIDVDPSDIDCGPNYNYGYYYNNISSFINIDFIP